MTFIIIKLNYEWDENNFNSNEMEDQIGTVLHWSHQKENEQAKSKDEVIKRNLDWIQVSAATSLPSNTTRRAVQFEVRT